MILRLIAGCAWPCKNTSIGSLSFGTRLRRLHPRRSEYGFDGARSTVEGKSRHGTGQLRTNDETYSLWIVTTGARGRIRPDNLKHPANFRVAVPARASARPTTQEKTRWTWKSSPAHRSTRPACPPSQ